MAQTRKARMPMGAVKARKYTVKKGRGETAMSAAKNLKSFQSPSTATDSPPGVESELTCNHEQELETPPYSYAFLIFDVLSDAERPMTSKQICHALEAKYPYFRNEFDPGWKSIVRHTLIENELFTHAKRCSSGWTWQLRPLPSAERGIKRHSPGLPSQGLSTPTDPEDSSRTHPRQQKRRQRQNTAPVEDQADSFMCRVNRAIDDFEKALLKDYDGDSHICEVLKSARARVLGHARESSFSGGETKDEALILDALQILVAGLEDK